MSFALVLAVALASPAPSPASAEAFEIVVGGRILGEETVTRESSPEGPVLKSRIALDSPKGKIEFQQTLRLAAASGEPVDYALEIAIPGAVQEVRARKGATGWTIEAGPAGAPTLTREHPIAGASILLDNNLASHLDLLARTAKLAPGESRSATFVVPQAAAAIAGTLSRLEDLADQRRFVVEMGGVRLEIDARATDGGLLEARVPLQHALYRRKGAPVVARTEGSPADPRERELPLKTPEGDLGGTLTIPKGTGPFPAVVLLSGSGPNDRHETVGPNAPFRDLARALADRGVASYRFDKATTSASVMAKRSVTLRAEYDDDAQRAIALVRGTTGIDPSRVFVVGHSLGAAVAPRVAREAGDAVVGAVLLAAPGRPTDELVVEQVRAQAVLAGQDPDATAAPVAAQLKVIRDGGGDAPFLGAPPSYWRETFVLDTIADLKSLGKPALVAQGDNDVQVNVERDFGRFRDNVGEDGGRVTYRVFPGLNHLLMSYDGKSTGAEYGAKMTVAPEVSEAIASWIARVASSAKDAPHVAPAK